jgi:hypothetical protein
VPLLAPLTLNKIIKFTIPIIILFSPFPKKFHVYGMFNIAKSLITSEKGLATNLKKHKRSF